jgi:cyclopropane fatty-acyl-phospholipid synthase-like methyltransferase
VKWGVLNELRRTLANVHLYIGLQKGLGTDRVRHRCLREAELRPGDSILDIGCGPAYYLDRLPAGVRYHGFDTSEPYLAYAGRRFGDQAVFHHGRLTADGLDALPRFDTVLLFGLLHHLNDEDCASLLDLTAVALVPGGRVISVDPAVHDGQGRVSRWLAVNDRGEHVRSPEAYDKLAAQSFGHITSAIWNDVMRVPYSQYVMKMRTPL